MNIDTFLDRLNDKPESITFEDTMAVIDANFQFTPTGFTNGSQVNAADENNGSCKLFAFAKRVGLTEAQTLICFGDYYRKDVMNNPRGEDHANIRNFMDTGWSGVRFDADPLSVQQTPEPVS